MATDINTNADTNSQATEQSFPGWIAEARAWQDQDTDTRSVLIITSDKGGIKLVFDGKAFSNSTPLCRP